MTDKESFEAHIYVNYHSYVDCVFCGTENVVERRLGPKDELECWNCDAIITVNTVKLIEMKPERAKDRRMSMTDIVWVCINHKSAKVWGYDAFVNDEDNTMEIIWYFGSVGRTMQQLTHKRNTYSYWDGYDLIHERINDKERKGYRRIPNHVYFKMIDTYQTNLKDYIAEADLP